jgi:hypothetical protein
VELITYLNGGRQCGPRTTAESEYIATYFRVRFEANRAVILGCKKVKLSRYRPGQALGVPGGLGFRISRQSAHEGGKVVSPTHRPSLPQEGFLVLISVTGCYRHSILL